MIKTKPEELGEINRALVQYNLEGVANAFKRSLDDAVHASKRIDKEPDALLDTLYNLTLAGWFRCELISGIPEPAIKKLARDRTMELLDASVKEVEDVFRKITGLVTRGR